jgi:hypothetical protein
MAFSLALLGASTYEAPAAGSYDLLATEILTGSTTSVTFSSLGTYAADYQHLQIRTTIFSAQANLMTLKLNATTETKSHVLRGKNSAVTSFEGGGYVLYCGSNTIPSATVIDILDPFETTKNKVVRSFSCLDTEVALLSGLWLNTSVLDSIELPHPNAFNFLAGSRFSLYGIRKAA